MPKAKPRKTATKPSPYNRPIVDLGLEAVEHQNRIRVGAAYERAMCKALDSAPDDLARRAATRGRA